MFQFVLGEHRGILSENRVQSYELLLDYSYLCISKSYFLVKFFRFACFLLCSLLLLAACSPTRFLPEGRSLLSSVSVHSASPQVHPSDYRLHVRQEANSTWLSLAKVPLGIYCLSGTDERQAFNRLMHRIGEAPVVYNDTLTRYSQQSLQQALRSKGYLGAKVRVDVQQKGRHTHLRYTLQPGRRSYVHDLHHRWDNDTIAQVVASSSSNSLLYKGMPLDLSVLDAERTRIVQLLRNSGYYHINNEYIHFTADTLPHSQAVELTQHFSLPPGVDSTMVYRAYHIGRVLLHEVPADASTEEPTDTTHYRSVLFANAGKQRVDRRVYWRNLFVQSDSLYRERATQYSYENLNALSAVKYSTLHYDPPRPTDSLLHAHVLVQLHRPHGIAVDLEGTNTAGDLGGALTLSYTHRNLLKGSESLSLKLRGAYEAVRRLEGYANQDYIEYGAESILRFPTLPFVMGEERLRHYKGTSEFSLLFNSQNRPEFHRRLLTASWRAQWTRHRQPNFRHHLDILSLNYVFMPWISGTFRREYLENADPRYSVLRSSYENLFIVKSSYGFTYSSLGNVGSLYQTNGYQIRANIESAGLLMAGISHLAGIARTAEGVYVLGNIPYSQYAKFDFDYAKSFRLNEKQSLALHAAVGVAVPYGNSAIVPYEKRYFAGGANSVRGWSVRTLGPGSYKGRDGNIDFINQTGTIKLDLSVEYRAPLFWRFEGAAFIDAGNVWNTRRYPNLNDGLFRFDRFYEQIAVAYGLGLRLNLSYFILRFDGGMKAIDPAASGRAHYPLLSPRFSRDFALHFAVGLPF